MPTNPLASIVILTYNNLQLTRQCLESIFQYTAYPDYEVVMVDNGSIDGTREFLADLADGHPKLRVILNKNNLGFAAGNNQGAQAARGDYLVFLNNDTVVTQGWLTGLLHHLQDRQAGLVGPVTNSIGNESRIAVPYENLQDMHAFASEYTTAHRDQQRQVDMLAFFCAALRTEVYLEIGPLDERFGRGMFEDDDYALRLKENGYQLYVAEDVFVHHWGSASFSRLESGEYWQLFEHNLKLFEEKWHVRWRPPLMRPEFLRERLREDIDAMIFFNQTIQDQSDRLNDTAATLQAIYASNGWAVLQGLLSIRRKLAPEGSRREVLLRGMVDALRQTSLFPLRRSIRQAQQPLETASAAPIWPAEIAAPSEAALSRHFNWPFISVILPVYNHAHMLVEAAHSVIHSNYPNFELLILDDGSSDEIEPVLRRLATNPRVKIYRQPNQKLPRALTHAHWYAQGEFLTWTSADNRMAPGALTAMAQKLLEHPQAALVYADVRVIDENGRPLYDHSYRPQNLAPGRPDIVRLYREGAPLGFETDNYINACFLYRRQAAEALHCEYADDLRGLEDYDFWLRLQKYGPLIHAGNEEPLYEYRVHKKTMSHELLTHERDEHLQRVQRLIDYEAERRAYAARRWQIQAGDDLPEQRWQELQAAAADLGVDLQNDDGRQKTIRVSTAPANKNVQTIHLQLKDSEWLLTCPTPQSVVQLSVPAGISVSPLALKARDDQRPNWEFPQGGQRPTIGLHAELAKLALKRETLQSLIRANPQMFFVFIDSGSPADPDFAADMLTNLENAVYLGARNWGEAYPVYANLDAFWLPPTEQPPPDHLQRRLLALAYSAGRPLLLPRGLDAVENAPFIYHYDPAYESLHFSGAFQLDRRVRSIMDRYLQLWSPAGRFEQLLKLADTATQETFTKRPDFGARAPARQSPVRWTTRPVAETERLRLGLLVNQLDKGGLEQVVADLAERLPQQGIEPIIFCYQAGGHIADRLQAAGQQVYIAGSKTGQLARDLKQAKPDLIHSHWANLQALEVAVELGLPIIETIHNTYVWLGESGWQEERERSLHFQHAAAVSELVRRYYARFNPGYLDHWITPVPNGIDPQRVQLPDRETARQQLGVSGNETLFLCLASYDGRKNQLALLTAFERASQQEDNLRLICAGHTADAEYFQKLIDFRSRLQSAEQIKLEPYHSDPSTLLAAADGFILNSFFEGWSLAATEALHAGLPLIHSDCGSGRELVGEHNQRGVLIPNPAAEPLEVNWELVRRIMAEPEQRNTEALTAALVKLAVEKDTWRQQRDEIAAFSRQHFSAENMVANYRTLYRQNARKVFG